MMNHTSLREVGYSNITEHVWYVVCVSVCVCVCVCCMVCVCVDGKMKVVGTGFNC